MSAKDWRLDYSERCYGALLLMYPAGFRLRFKSEMVQLFRDCCFEEPLYVVWLRTLKDLAFSIVQERTRALMRSIEGEQPVAALLDHFLIPLMIVINLLVLGPFVTLLIHGVPASRIPADEFAFTSAMVALALGSLGVLRALIMARVRPTVRLWVKLS